MNFMTKCRGPENTTSGYMQVSGLLCPSDGVTAQPNAPWGTNNYAGNFGGPGAIQRFSGTVVPARKWVADAPGPITTASVTDGTSNTALFSEHLLGVPNAQLPQIVLGSPKRGRGFFPSGKSVANNQYNGTAATGFLATCKALPSTTVAKNSLNFGYIWSVGYYIHSVSMYTHYNTPNTFACHNTVSETTQWWDAASGAVPPTSNHPGGVNMTFADGSVKFIKDSIGLPTWWALGTREGGETVSSDSY